jgi:HAD superfamily hydrolase (TIGR01509 family)
MGALAVGSVKAAELDGVTLDAYGTLLTVVDPVASLHELLPDHDPVAIATAFRRESAFYQEQSSTGSDFEQLERLHERSVAVFNDALGSSLSPAAYAGAFEFELLPGVEPALSRLRALGLTLAVVANWDISLHDRLARVGIDGFFATVVHAARKPAPDGILQGLDTMHVFPERALHVGDSETDEQAAHAAGVRFLPAALPDAVATIA